MVIYYDFTSPPKQLKVYNIESGEHQMLRHADRSWQGPKASQESSPSLNMLGRRQPPRNHQPPFGNQLSSPTLKGETLVVLSCAAL